MNLYISRVEINNFRNFKHLDVSLADKAVIVGENKCGKTNFLCALRLILDPDLPDSARQLKEDDFWSGLDDPMKFRQEISVSIELSGFEDNEKLLAILSDYIVDSDSKRVARITYKFAPTETGVEEDQDEGKIPPYEFSIYGGVDPTNTFNHQQRKWLPLQVLPALRNVEADLESWSRSPLRPLIENLKVAESDLAPSVEKIGAATGELLNLPDIKKLSDSISDRLEKMIGKFYSVSPTLGIAATDAIKILRSLKLFMDGPSQRTVSQTSLGICNVIYLTLLMLELERKEESGERATTILAIEEPEAHLHPHLQRLVYRDFLKRNSSVILTTHSPHIVSVTPVRSIALIKPSVEGSIATSTAKIDITDQEAQDIERYLDVTRSEIFFARAVVLVEGDAEEYVVPTAAELLDKPFDPRGISVCSVQGVDFAPYIKLLSEKALGIPFSVLTDGDPYTPDGQSQTFAGFKRSLKFAQIFKPEKSANFQSLYEQSNWRELHKELKDIGIFVNRYTLEIDLANAGNQEAMTTALTELGAGSIKIDKFKASLSDLAKQENIEYILKKIEEIGKGRFAQRLAGKLTKEKLPPYLKDAINFITESINPE